MFGQILMGLGQPFVLTAPTRYSDLWFTNRGRVAATAVMSLANPFGGALAQLIDPFWADQPHQVPDMVLYIAIIVCSPCPPFEVMLMDIGNYCLRPFIFHPSTPTNSPLSIRARGKATPNPIPQIPFHLSRILHDNDPLHHLRRSLQQPLLPHKPNARTLLFHRNRRRHSRRPPHRRRPRSISHHLPNHRQNQNLPPSNQDLRPGYSYHVPSLHLGTQFSQSRRCLRYSFYSGRCIFQSRPRSPRIPDRDNAPRFPRSNVHNLLDRRTTAWRYLHPRLRRSTRWRCQ